MLRIRRIQSWATAEDFVRYTDSALQSEYDEIKSKYIELIEGISNEKSMQQILGKQSEAAFVAACTERKKELETAWQSKLEQTRRVYENRKQYLMKMFSFFMWVEDLFIP
jgi:hypothetical protein